MLARSYLANLRLQASAFTLTVALGFTTAAFAQAPPDPFASAPRNALIVGNCDYDLNGVVEGNPTHKVPEGYFADLPDACNDAELVRTKLLAAGWKESEIQFETNLNTGKLRGALANFREKLSNSDISVLNIFYYSGHGAQIDIENNEGKTSRNFLFGVGANINIEQAAASLQQRPGNASFFATSAVGLHELVAEVGELPDDALVVILDACRDDPVFQNVGRLPNSPGIKSTAPEEEEYSGILVAYATSKGHFAYEGVGPYSIYTQSLAERLKPNLTFDEIFNELQKEIPKVAGRMYPLSLPRQRPRTHGRLNAPPKWCVYECRPEDEGASSPVANATPIPLTYNWSMRPIRVNTGEMKTDGLPDARAARVQLVQASQSVASGREANVIFKDYERAQRRLDDLQLEAPKLPSNPKDDPDAVQRFQEYQNRIDSALAPLLNIDVFWCDGMPNSAEHLARASAMAERLGQAAKEENALGTPGSVGRIAVRPLSFEANLRTGYRQLENAIIFEAGVDRDVSWANRAADALGNPVSLRPSPTKSSGYIRAYVCRVPEASVVPAKVVLHFPDPILGRYARDLLRRLVAAVPPPVTDPPVPEFIERSPDFTTIKYYHAGDLQNVFALAAKLETEVKDAVRIRFLPEDAPNVRPGTIEVWLGKKDPAIEDRIDAQRTIIGSILNSLTLPRD